MALQKDEIRKIIENKGKISFRNNPSGRQANISTGITDTIVETNYTKSSLTVNVGSNEIIVARADNSNTDNNCIDVQTIDALATAGSVRMPGYVYTGNFSGCVFYLYRTGPNEVTGVHAYSGSQPVYGKNGFFGKKKVIGQAVREFSPQDYFKRNPAQLICRYPTRQELDLSTGEQSLSFLSCVENNTATTYLFSAKGAGTGAQICRLIRAYHVRF
ncbi:hypothetical protein [Mesorhizobium sp. CAU 1741]|uniref:hypothetical protein n=1 Tax=Mesorhizobium sp. CAU 1741 TaxID=3140366 RepID=UPI00325B3C8E